MATSPTMRKLLALVHEYAAEPAPDDSDAAAERDLNYFDRILGILGHNPDLDPTQAAQHVAGLDPGVRRRAAGVDAVDQQAAHQRPGADLQAEVGLSPGRGA